MHGKYLAQAKHKGSIQKTLVRLMFCIGSNFLICQQFLQQLAFKLGTSIVTN